jgi:hypothetical protein
MICYDDACPREREAPSPAPGPVECDEIVVRFVLLQAQLIRNAEGQPVLTAAAFPKEELRGTRGKSVSVLREEHTAPLETARRAQAMNREQKWSSDPVLARGSVISLRSIRDTEGRREVCVNADPTTDENDKWGPCPSHASILRADPPLDITQRLEWQMLRVKLAEQFNEIRHQSGREVDLTI